MIDVDEFIAQAHERAIQFKTMRAEDPDDDGEAAVPFIVVGNRGEEMVGIWFPTNRNEMLWTTQIVIGAFGCDLVAGTIDAYEVSSENLPPGTSGLTNPDTGEQWRQGDMQRAFEAGRPWVTEQMSTHALDKASQTLTLLNQQYVVANHTITWQDPRGPFHETDSSSDISFHGLVPDTLRQLLAEPDFLFNLDHLLQESFGINADVFGLTDREKRIHTDMAAVRICVDRGIAVVYAVSDADTYGIVEMSLGDDAHNAAMGVPGLRMQTIIPGLHRD